MTRGEDGEAVLTGVVEVEFTVHAWNIEGVDKFDWMAESGRESTELFDSADEAFNDAVHTLGG